VVRVALAELAEPLDERDEDAELVDRFRSGDGRAFDELVRRYQRQVYYLSLRYVKNGEDAKDITQRAFVRAFQGVKSLRGGASFRTWLFKIAVNLSLNHIRDHARLRPAEDAGELPVDAVGAERLSEDEAKRQLRDALEELPPKQRLVAAKVNFPPAVTKLRAWIGGIRDRKGKGKTS
jgi:RNA polymerase sigma-70 factor (ECF subfamily)